MKCIWLTTAIAWLLCSYLLIGMVTVANSATSQTDTTVSPYTSIHQKLSLSKEEEAFLAQHPVIRISNELDLPLFDYNIDGQPLGFSVDIVYLLAKYIGFEVEFVYGYKWSELLQMLRDKQIDVVHAAKKTVEREAYSLFTPAYFHSRTVFITNTATEPVNGIGDLYGKRFAVPKGWATAEFMQLQYPQIELIETTNVEQAFALVQQGKADFATEQQALANYMIHKHKQQNDLKVNGLFREYDEQSSTGLRMMVRNDWSLLHGMLTRAIETISPQEILELERKWLRFNKGDNNALQLTEAEQKFIQQNKPITIAIDPAWLPMEWINPQTNQYEGISADLLQRISSLSGLQFNLIVTKSWNETIDLVKRGLVDMLPAVSKTTERERFLDFSIPAFVLSNAVVMRQSAPFIHSIDDLLDMRIGVREGNSLHSYLQNTHPHLTIVPLKDSLDGLNKLLAGKLDAYTDTQEVLAYLINQNQLNGLKLVIQVPEKRQLHIAFRKEYPAEALAIINKALAAISSDERSAIYSKWISLPTSSKVDVNLIWQLALGGVVLLILIFIWNRYLARLNQRIQLINTELQETQKIARLGSWELDIATQIITWSEEAIRIAGFVADQKIETYDDYLKLVHPDDMPRLMTHIQQAQQGESFEIELRQRLADGNYCYMLTRAKPLILDGAINKIIGSIMDISELKQTERALDQEIERRKESEEMFRNMFEKHSAVMYLVDTETLQILDANQSAQEFYGFSHDEFICKTLADLNVISLEELFALRKIYIDELGWRYQPVQHRLASGEVRDLEIYTSKIHYSGKSIYFSTIYDVTEKLQYESALKKAKQEAEASNQFKSQFLANMSHEIRTPMNAIIGMTYLALQTQLNEKQFNYINKAHYSAESLLRIINDILDFSKIEAGKIEMESIDFYLQDVLDNISTLISLKCEEKGVELLFDIDPQLPPALIGDPLRLGQVLINLANNAVKFTDRGTITVSVKALQQDHATITLQCSVSDSGIGIPEEQQKHLFEAFSQADGSTTRKYGGTGLGLTISKNLVELMGGTIWVESRESEGSTFHFTLQLGVQPNPQPRVNNTIEPKQYINQLRGAHLLVVDDNEINQELMSELLLGNDMTIELAGNGAEALTLLQQGKQFDAVLMDVQMPIMDGYTAARAIRKIEQLQQLPIIAMTANVMAKDIEEAKIAGMNDHIGKPIRVNEMFQVLAQWVKVSNQPIRTHIERVNSVQPSEDNVPLLPKLAGISMESGLAASQKRQGLYRRLLLKFADKLAEFEKQYRAVLASGDMTAAKREAHTLKGVAANLGANDLSAAAAQLELLFLQGKPTLQQIEQQLQILLQQVAIVLPDLQVLQQSVVAEETNAANTDLQLDRVLPMFDRLEQLLEEYDSEATELALTITPLLAGSSAAKEFAKIASAISEYQFEAALKIVRTTKQLLQQQA